MKINRYIFALTAIACWLLTVSCDTDNIDKLQGLGSRVTYLEENLQKLNADMEALNTLIKNIQMRGYVTNIEQKDDGTWVLTYNTGDTVTIRNGKDGADGNEATLVVSVRQDTDGQWYWILNGQWLLDSNGNKIRAGATDGTDGKNGRDGADGTLPLMRVNDLGYWEVSTDGGKTWTTTGKPANGKDGKDGRTDIFSSVTLSADGTYLIIVLTNGESFTVPIM